MIKVHMGLKGSGKTPKMLEAIDSAVQAEKGNVVCIAEGDRLMHSINRKARMVTTDDFDITHIFIDSIFKSVPSATVADLEGFVDSLEKLEKKFNVSFTVMVSAEASEAGEKVKKYMD